MKRKTALLLLLVFLAVLTVSCRALGGQEEKGPAAPELTAAPENTPEQTPLPVEITIPPAETQEPAEDELVRAVQEVTGYGLEGDGGVDGAGYKDWAIDALEIPSLTIEVGCQEAALAEREIYSIFARNYRVLPAIARWLQR